jgi:hypothetical protein
MIKQKTETKNTEKKNQIVSFLGIIPVLRITHKVGVIEENGKKFVRISKMYWLFGFFPLFKTERDLCD